MSLIIQIKTIIVSILFGILLFVFLYFNQSIIYNKNKYIKIPGTLTIMFLTVLLYFLLIKYVNNGIFHIYEIFLCFIGFIIAYLIAIKIKK